MAIELDHTIVPAKDKEASARFFARIFGLEYKGPMGHFAPVEVNESLTIDFDDGEGFQSHHLAFKVGDEEFDGILERVKAEGLPYGSQPWSRTDRKLNDRRGGRGFYFDDPNGHVLEAFTR
ncbi:MAG: VOC family protein [Chloroflexi bacterium]|nr:VOC family protein [Chloroflexota bacterium]